MTWPMTSQCFALIFCKPSSRIGPSFAAFSVSFSFLILNLKIWNLEFGIRIFISLDSPYCSYCLRFLALIKASPAAIKHAAPPVITDSGAPIRHSSGEIVGAILVFRDVTERRQAENKLRESEADFRRELHADDRYFGPP